MDIATFEQRFQSGLDAMNDMSLPAARRHYDALCSSFAPSRPAGMALSDVRIEDVPVRRYRPARCRPGKVLYVHGGGFSLGSLDSHQGIAEGLAQALEREVISIDYRLMPEARYACAMDDCRRVFETLAPVALVGDSAGARLILDVVANAIKVPVLGLIYPLVGVPTPSTLGPDAPLLSRDEVLAAWPLIEQDAPAGDGLYPPAECVEVLAVERDPLTIPLEHAVTAWRKGGADVGYHLAANMLHGCLHARESLPDMAEAWQRFCGALGDRLG
ncbi:alpha/beta hydrolase fold domain-containing protein [Oceanisphaera arctica]|uniref:Lipolytic protein n=1 Tax=Oceanisphaera arctica TaxID=641510 RepID=A0A2P5TL09_9GAMM|nr:alpha/beta hydrolase fold domain-containing protein [Oceanisphaera arctica]PPL15838.1 lipolytic protein [Oceanisphaera arctica]GHA10669.1 carboxylesterase [Oceanisphaera arctica]